MVAAEIMASVYHALLTRMKADPFASSIRNTSSAKLKKVDGSRDNFSDFA